MMTTEAAARWRAGGGGAQAGVRRATGPEMSGEGFKLRRSPVVAEPLLVSGDDGAFVSFVPGPTCPPPPPPRACF